MRAGLLARNFITIQRYENEQTDSGQITRVLKTIAETRCNVIRQSGKATETADGKELFDYVQLIFQVRFIPDVLDSDVILFNKQYFKITFIDNNVWDRTMRLTAVKINK